MTSPVCTARSILMVWNTYQLKYTTGKISKSESERSGHVMGLIPDWPDKFGWED